MNLEKLLNQLDGLNESRIATIFTALNDELRTELTSTTSTTSTVSVTSLARLLLFYAYSLSDDKKTTNKSASANSPGWIGVDNEISEFLLTLPEPVARCCFRSYTDDKIAQFATLASRVKGTPSPYFYSTLVLFLIHLNDNGSFDKPYLLAILSKDDAKLVSSLAHLVSNRFNRALSTGEQPSPDAPATDFEAAVRFNILQTNNKKLTRFIDYYSSGEKGIAHMVMYRAMKSDPSRLMKTFLTLSPPTHVNYGANNAVFSHFYKAPMEKREKNLRFSSGKALPLDQGVYLVGGQRPWAPDSRRHPFSSLKVIALEWIDLDQCHPLMSVLVMSTNYKGKIFISRAVARVTPFVHHSDVELEALKISDLTKNLQADYHRESRYIEGEIKNNNDTLWDGKNGEHFLVNLDQSDAPTVADFITRNTNNNPRGNDAWTVREGFTRVADKNTESLTSAKLQSAIEDSLTDNKNNTFENHSGEPYDVWSSTRFGPLSSDAES